MTRREFAVLLGGVMAWPFVAGAQQPPKTFHIGYLTASAEASAPSFLAAFRGGMRDRGYAEGRNYSIEARYAEGRLDQLGSLAKELLSLDPDVLLVATTPANLAAKAATSTIPIVMVSVADPIGAGLVESLSRRGGNITGITNMIAEMSGKRLEILKEIVPAASKVAVLINPDDPNAPLQMRHAQAAASALSVELAPVLSIRSAQDLKSAFDAAVRAQSGAALRMIDPIEGALRAQTVELAAAHRLPVMFPSRIRVESGGLVSYSTNFADEYRQAAGLVDKILKGAKPADLPVEQPTKFELVVNLTTAKALGITIPQQILLRADEVIE